MMMIMMMMVMIMLLIMMMMVKIMMMMRGVVILEIFWYSDRLSILGKSIAAEEAFLENL